MSKDLKHEPMIYIWHYKFQHFAFRQGFPSIEDILCYKCEHPLWKVDRKSSYLEEVFTENWPFETKCKYVYVYKCTECSAPSKLPYDAWRTPEIKIETTLEKWSY